MTLENPSPQLPVTPSICLPFVTPSSPSLCQIQTHFSATEKSLIFSFPSIDSSLMFCSAHMTAFFLILLIQALPWSWHSKPLQSDPNFLKLKTSLSGLKSEALLMSAFLTLLPIYYYQENFYSNWDFYFIDSQTTCCRKIRFQISLGGSKSKKKFISIWKTENVWIFFWTGQFSKKVKF